MTLPTTGQAPHRVILPECQFSLHAACKTDGVYVRGEFRVPADTPGATMVVPAKRCDCSCHQRRAAR